MKQTIHTFTIPKNLQQHGVKTVAMAEITGNEDIMAAKRAGTDSSRVAFELAIESLREVDGTKVSTADGTAQAAFDRLHPKVRTLVMLAYQRLHQPAQDETEAFLQSRQVTL